MQRQTPGSLRTCPRTLKERQWRQELGLLLTPGQHHGMSRAGSMGPSPPGAWRVLSVSCCCLCLTRGTTKSGSKTQSQPGFLTLASAVTRKSQLVSLVTALSDLAQRLVITFGLDLKNAWKSKSMILHLNTAATLLFWFSEDCVNQKYLTHLQKGLVPANHGFNYRK